MPYISAIAVDFGSTNSGCARITSFDQDGNLTYATPHLVHSTGLYAKDNTWFYIEPGFLQSVKQHYETLNDSAFRIESRVLHTDNPNIIWGRASIKEFSEKIIEEHWVSFKNFKMLLRDGISGTKLDLPLLSTIKLFLRILKIECLSVERQRMGREVTADEINWGLTIPAIWNDQNKQIMVECVHEIFSKKARILSESEGPLVANLLSASGDGQARFTQGRTSLVIDVGGGTTDICLMKEVKRPDGSFKFEMVADTDGSAAGGNDVDKDFYLYMLRFISKGKKSDNGIAYDMLEDEALLHKLLDGFKSNIREFMEFEDNWLRLKGSRNLGRTGSCEFIFTNSYMKWLKNNGHKEISAVVRDMLIDGCAFPSQVFVAKVLTPTFSKICSKIEEIINRNLQKGVRFDTIILAGGMSLNYHLNVRIKQTINKLLGNKGMDAIRETPGLFAGSAVMTGTCYLLIHRGAIERIAKRNYYYDCRVGDISRCLRKDYQRVGIDIKLGEIQSLIEDESEYTVIKGDGKYLILRPVVLKDRIIGPYHETLCSSEGQKKLNIVFYSSGGEKIVFANEANPLLKKEGELETECKESADYDLEIDFNEAVISNALRYILKSDAGDYLSEGYLEDVATNESYA